MNLLLKLALICLTSVVGNHLSACHLPKRYCQYSKMISKDNCGPSNALNEQKIVFHGIVVLATLRVQQRRLFKNCQQITSTIFINFVRTSCRIFKMAFSTKTTRLLYQQGMLCSTFRKCLKAGVVVTIVGHLKNCFIHIIKPLSKDCRNGTSVRPV